MKKKLIYMVAAVCLLFGTSSCDDFGNVNNDPEHPTGKVMDFSLLFTGVQVGIAGTDWEVWRNGLIYSSTMIQHTASTENYWNGDKYTYNEGYNAAYWERYTGAVRNLFEVLNAWKDDETRVDEYNMARIMKVMLFHRMTDMYGDVPYFDAGQGYIAGVFYPKYDKQEDIYDDMLKELNEAAIALNNSTGNRIGTADLVYRGNAQRWKQFSYSLMVRLSMRLSRVDQDKAKQWVNTAIDGGVFTSNADNAKILHDANTDDSAEAYGKVASLLDPDAFRLSKTFVDHLKDTEDPRLSYIATVSANPKAAWGQSSFDYGDTTKAIQLGMPNGYDQLEGATDISTAPNWPGHDYVPGKPTEIQRNGMTKYSIVNRYTYGRLDAPTFLITHSQVQLLLAEAAERGWISGSAENYYKAGITAAMQLFSEYGVQGIDQVSIDKYLIKNAYNAAQALEQINTQYWVVTFMDEYETFANWRRSGYPVLKPVNYFGNVTQGTIPRRFTYPVTESTNNSTNYYEAVADLSNGDTMTSKVWWDK